MKIINNLKFTWKYAKGQKKNLILFIICNIVSVFIFVVYPIISAKVIIALTSNEYVRILLLGLVLFLSKFVNNGIRYLYSKMLYIMHSKTLSILEIDIAKNVLKIENECLDNKGSGLFIQRLTNDTSKMADAFGSITDMISNFVKYVGVLIAILIVNKFIFLILLFMLVILFMIEKHRTNILVKNDEIARKASEKATSFIGELIRGSRDIKMLNCENDFINALSLKIKDANDKKMKMKNTNRKYNALLMWNIMDFFSFILIIVLVILLKEKIIVPTMALVIHNYFTNVEGFVYVAGDFLDFIKNFNLSCDRIYAILNDDEFRKEEFGSKHVDKINGDFEFSNVCFGYNEKKVLKNLSFKIESNTTTAFVGRSGAGKTTIFNLLCKMYNVNSGTIKIDGISINELDKDSIRGNTTIISQNPYIFNMSIRDNLKIVKTDLTEVEMKEACKMACLEDFIKELSDGYDTIIGEGGVNLSGGQKQRLAIARALVQKTEIILFDEATSALDNETQEKIQKAIENMKREYTILIIAHRLSTIINADKIMLLDDGKVKCEGTHKELLAKSVEYKKLYETELLDDNEN